MQSENTRKAEAARKHAVYLLTHPGAKTLAQISAEKKAKALRTEKSCRMCGEIKPISAFGVLSHVADGHRYECYECRRVMWRKEHPVKPKPEKPTYANFSDTPQYAAHRKWVKAHPEHAKALKRAEYRRQHPEAKTIAEVIQAKEAKKDRTEKACKRCGAVKPMSDFTPMKTTADGRLYQCRDCVNQTSNKWSAANRDKVIAKSKRWQSKNQPKMRHIAQRRRARKKGVSGSHTLQEWQALCKKFKNRCVRCGKAGKLTCDHVIPITDPRSSHDITNIQPLCYSCNSSKGNHHAADYRKTPFKNQGQLVMF